MYVNAYEMKMPTNYVDMNADEIEYGAGASGNGEYRKNLKKARYTDEGRARAENIAIGMVCAATGGIGMIVCGTAGSFLSIASTLVGLGKSYF